MDTKRNDLSIAFPTTYEVLHDKYGKASFDAVIVADDNALTFVHTYRDELFPDTPVIFCGVNDYEDNRVRRPWLTGVVEAQDYFGIIDLALQIDPGRSHFYVVSDHTLTGRAMLKGVRQVMPLFKDRARFTELVGPPVAEMQQVLKTLPADAVVLYLSYYKLQDGTLLTLQSSIDTVLTSSSAPVYSPVPDHIHMGVVGGVMLSARLQGEVAASLSGRVLEGVSPADLPLVTDSPNVIMVNYKVLKRFNYALSRVPAEAQVLNQPFSIWKTHRTTVIIVLVLGGLQFAVIVLLIANMRRRVLAEKSMKAARDLVLNIINSMPSVLVHVDSAGNIVSMNASALAMVGKDEDDIKGLSLTDVFPHLARHAERVLNAIDTGAALKLQRASIVLEGEPRYFDIETYPLREQEIGEGGGAVVRIDDVSDAVQMETVIIQTEKMLSLGGLAAGMAHEINNPLGGILQGAQNIERRVSPGLPANMKAAEKVGCDLSKVYAYLEERGILRLLQGIRDSGARAAEIVSHMLDFSRGEASRRTLVDMHKLVNNALELARNDYDLRSHYDFMQVACRVDTEPDMPLVPCRSSEIEQVLFNLFKNAAQAMASMERPLSEAVLNVRIFTRDGQAVIEVEDNGPGLDPVTRTRVFEPFFTTKGPRVGTGLGLSVSYFIITRNHGGSFTVESELGKGACFIISIPLAERADEDV
ncbi:ATP-binding protein [Desulfovibrio mangrovi]|uniref:ATP-binding protein n=1 Tax=Desulfovibrio mangrovi TaxID=2976983 RepID=UPI002246CCD0|nr:ATP-binding protein [Desulfovibrio mangrovi]UZP67141.1 ATP-binding protein [Desulfovibrio mangrovi]